MDDEESECPHGLNPAWCTFCKKKAAGELPHGARRPRPPATPKPRSRPAPETSGPRARVAPPRRPATVAAPPRTPAAALGEQRKVVFHAASYRAWPSIAEFGLLPASDLLAGDPRLRSARSEPVQVSLAEGYDITVREQRAMARSNIEAHLDGLSIEEWLDLINERVFFFARQRELTTYVGRQRDVGSDVLAFDTARLLRAAAGRAEVTRVNPTGPVPWQRCKCRGRATFERVDTFRGDVAEIEELTVVGPIESVADLVVRVTRHHPDGTSEVLLG